eukprot:71160-Prorocentrum_lima.AAC.1
MKSRGEEHATQLREKEASANHDMNAMPSDFKKKEDGLLAVYKKKPIGIEQVHAAKESAAMVTMQKKQA